MYTGMSEQGSPSHIELDAQLILFNELFGWARIAFKALTDRSPPDIMYGPSPEGKSLQHMEATNSSLYRTVQKVQDYQIHPGYQIHLEYQIHLGYQIHLEYPPGT